MARIAARLVGFSFSWLLSSDRSISPSFFRTLSINRHTSIERFDGRDLTAASGPDVRTCTNDNERARERENRKEEEEEEVEENDKMSAESRERENIAHLLAVRVHLHPGLRLHPSPLFPNSDDVTVGGESTAKRAVYLLPGEGFHRGRGSVDLLVLDRVHVRLDEGEEGVLLLGDPILRPLPLLQQYRRRFRGHAPRAQSFRPRPKHRSVSSNLKLIHAESPRT